MPKSFMYYIIQIESIQNVNFQGGVMQYTL
jgi:hypothetical protein